MSGATEAIEVLRQRFANSDIHWEQILTDQYGALPRFRTTVDIGAHAGLHTAPLRAKSDRVVCFEPIPELAAALRSHFQGEDDVVIVHQCALSTETRVSTFELNHRIPSESGLVQRLGTSDTSTIETIEVHIRRLDDFGLATVDYIKSDCEGADLLALRGGLETIRRDRPVMSVEYGFAGYSVYGLQRRSIFDFAIDVGYGVADLFGNRITAAEMDAVLDRYYWDFFLIPDERDDAWTILARNGRAILDDIERYVVQSA